MFRSLKDRASEFGFVIWFLILTLVIGATLGLGTLAWRATFGVKQANIEREIFLESQSQVQGAIRDLANYRREYNQTDDEQERGAIAQLIINRLNHVELDQIPDQELRIFLQDIRAGRL